MPSKHTGSIIRSKGPSNSSTRVAGKGNKEASEHKQHLVQLEAHRRRAIAKLRQREEKIRERKELQRVVQEREEQMQNVIAAGLARARTGGDRSEIRRVIRRQAAVAAAVAAVKWYIMEDEGEDSEDEDSEDDDYDDVMSENGSQDKEDDGANGEEPVCRDVKRTSIDK